MYNTLGIVQARLGSTRLKGKIARKLGGTSLLEWVVRRVTDSQRLDKVIVAADDSPGGEEIRGLAPRDVPVFYGSEQDVLGRFLAALEEFPARGVMRICADNPFIDPELIDRLIRTADEHPDCDYISYCTRSGRPVILSTVGVCSEWCRAESLRRAASLTSDPLDREHVTRFLYNRPDLFKIRLIPLPPELDRDDLRLTVDYEEDWEHAQTIYDALGPEALEWRRIAELVERQPGLRHRMAELNGAHAKV